MTALTLLFFAALLIGLGEMCRWSWHYERPQALLGAVLFALAAALAWVTVGGLAR